MKYSSLSFYICFTILFLLVLTSVAQNERHYSCYKTTNKIVIDGLLNEPDWSHIEWSQDFVDITGNATLVPTLRTRFKMLWDNKFIYLAAEITEHNIWATIHKRDSVIFNDNDFELFIDPDGNGLNYYEIEVNAYGTIWDLMLTKAYKNHGIPLTSWDLKGLRTGIHINGSINDPLKSDSSWIVEMAIPIKELMMDKQPNSWPADGVQWRVNFSRVEWKTEVKGSTYVKKKDSISGKQFPEQNWVWSPMGEIAMHIPERWGRLEFLDEKVIPSQIKYKNDHQKEKFNIWVWMGEHSRWSKYQWDSIFRLFHTHGIKGILIQADSATLVRIIPIAHKHEIIVEEWFVTMMNNNNYLFSHHPDWFVVNRDGKSSITDPAYVNYYRFLCPTNPEVQSYLKSRIMEYLQIPDLDGIHLDYIRFPDVILPQALWNTYKIVQDKEYAQYDYCYCKYCREQYEKIYGLDPLSMQHPENDIKWSQFRMDQISSLVNELSNICHKHGKKISAAVFPGPSLSKQLVRQEWNKWSVDEIMPMLYQNFYYGSLDWIRLQTEEGIKSLIDKNIPLYSGLYIPSLNPREMQSAIMKSIEGGSAGICLFTYESMSSEHWKALDEILAK